MTNEDFRSRIKQYLDGETKLTDIVDWAHRNMDVLVKEDMDLLCTVLINFYNIEDEAITAGEARVEIDKELSRRK